MCGGVLRRHPVKSRGFHLQRVMGGEGWAPGDGRASAFCWALSGGGCLTPPLTGLDVSPTSSRENVVFSCLLEHRVCSGGGR